MDLKLYLEACQGALVAMGLEAKALEETRLGGVDWKEAMLGQLDVETLEEAIEEELATLERVERERSEYVAANRDFLSSGVSASLAMKECEALLWPAYMAAVRASGGKVDAKQRDFGWPGWRCVQEDYLAVKGACTSAVRELSDLDVSIEGSKRRLHLLMGRLRLAASTLNFLGGG